MTIYRNSLNTKNEFFIIRIDIHTVKIKTKANLIITYMISQKNIYMNNIINLFFIFIFRSL
jgi:hypothetical protein